MHDPINREKSHEGGGEKIKRTKDKRSPMATEKWRTRTGGLVESWSKDNVNKIRDRTLPSENEIYRNFQAVLLATFVLVLSYHGFRYGRTEYSVLENGRMVHGFVSARRAVITFSLGYSIGYSFISSLAACMLLYSILSKKPRWSLPLIVVYMMDLVCHVADALVAFWLFFSYLKLSIALMYTTVTALIITAELWIWLGVLRLYEQRAFK